MKDSIFNPRFEDLPHDLPLYPLSGIVLLPGSILPLNVSEPRYLAMVLESLSSHRMIGIIQPREEYETPIPNSATLYHTGCVGRITVFQECKDSLFILLTGTCRFVLVEDMKIDKGYRQAKVDFSPYQDDMKKPAELSTGRKILTEILKPFLDSHGLSTDWNIVEMMQDHDLLAGLAMGLPFGMADKQAILEAKDDVERCHILTELLKMALNTNNDIFYFNKALH